MASSSMNNNNASAEFTADLDAFWKSNGDFYPLQAAGRQVNAVLRQDEQDADLYSRISAQQSQTPHHLYFCDQQQQQGSVGAATLRSNTVGGAIPNGTTTTSPGGSTAMAASSRTPPPLMSLQHTKTRPLPTDVANHLKTVHSISLMGLFAEAKMAWMTVDATIYLWEYGDDTVNPEDYYKFVVPSRQFILSAGLVRPKPKGVFKQHANIEWCLVITVPDEIFLIALARPEPPAAPSDMIPSPSLFMGGSGSSSRGSPFLRLILTTFSLPTDDTRILSVVGTANGRIFLGGDNGHVYEMTYWIGEEKAKKVSTVEEQLDAFYDQGKNIPETISDQTNESVATKILKLGKRALITFENGGLNGYTPPRKCRKVDVSSNVPLAIKAVVPDFIINTAAFLFSGRANTGKIEKLVVDEARKCLYTLSDTGWICSYDLSTSTAQNKNIRLAATMDGSATARLYLETVSRGQMFPPSTAYLSNSTGNIQFSGGGSSAQAGVGGMDGARAILKMADYRRGSGGGTNRARSSSSDSSVNILKPVSIHVIAPSESSRLTLMAVTEGGLRLYLSSLAPHVLSSGPNASRYGGSSTSNRYRSNSNPLSPGNRITLCHVRAPPPIDQTFQNFSTNSAGFGNGDGTVIEGGIVPRIQGGSKLAKTDASAYQQGVHVTALTKPSSQNNRRINSSPSALHRDVVGDVIVVTCPDAIIRKKTAASSSTNNGSSAVVRVEKQQCGLAETMSLPMSSAYGGGASNNSSATLPGGTVWAIAPLSTEQSAVMTMMKNSETPTETELGSGLPPEYHPPSKIHARDFEHTKAMNGSSASTSTDIVAHSSPIRKLKVFGNTIVNVMTSRPLLLGLEFNEPLGGPSARDYDSVPNFRISKLDCSRGFSMTAAETSSSRAVSSSPGKTSRNARSARLRPWLLRPATVPLGFLSTMYFEQSEEMVALNNGGLHYFGQTTLLSRLVEALIKANVNVDTDPSITAFFTGYGYKEGCCMCLALAIGCGPAGGNVAFSDQVRNRAATAALKRAYFPKLVVRPEQLSAGTVMTGVDTTIDPLVPNGYEFRASALSEGLTALSSRLMRPFWHKPAVVVTEGRAIEKLYSNDKIMSPAKVEILLNETTLEEIGVLLRELLKLMKDRLSPAIKTVPGATQNQGGNFMDVDENDGGQFLTRALQYNSHMRGGNSGSTKQLTASEAEHIARLIEEKNIHSLYRLLARVVQLLNLISLLRSAQDLTELRQVDWGLLHGLTTAQLVQTAEGQDRLEKLLNALVTSSVSKGPQQSAQADQLAELFAGQCYLFFSPGSRFAYLGLRKANEALEQPESSSSRISLENQAFQHFRQAAHHWYSAPLITGRILHTKGKESYRQIALLAMNYGSPLAKAVDALMELKDVAGVVDICLITAANFKTDRAIAARYSDPYATQQRYELSWEHNLYHKRRDVQMNGTGMSAVAGTSTIRSPSSQIIPYGTEVTSQDAIDTCYALIFCNLSELLNKRSALADKMVLACSVASDVAFLEACFNYLLQNDHDDTLLGIDIPALDKWLRERNNPELLWRYYNVQRRHLEAGQVAVERARDDSYTLSLTERMEWLSRSQNSFKNALEEGQPRGRSGVGPTDNIKEKEKEIDASLKVARLQNRILDSSKPDQMTPELHRKLAFTLVPVSTLFNEYAAALAMWEICLRILHTCRCNCNDPGAMIQTCWKKVFCEELLPCSTRYEATFRFLQSFVEDIGCGDQVKLLAETEELDSLELFENMGWEKPLVRRVVDLGKELYTTGEDNVFPVDFILSSMEGLKNAIPGSLSPGWALVTLAESGVPFLEVLAAYETFTESDRVIQQGIVDVDKSIERVSAVLELLEYWVFVAQSNVRTSGGRGNAANQELSSEFASGHYLRNKIIAIKGRIDLLHGVAPSMLARLQKLEEDIRFIA